MSSLLRQLTFSEYATGVFSFCRVVVALSTTDLRGPPQICIVAPQICNVAPQSIPASVCVHCTSLFCFPSPLLRHVLLAWCAVFTSISLPSGLVPSAAPRFCIFSRRPSSSPLLRNHCNACAARPRTCLVPLPSSPRVLLHVDARATIPDQETDRVCTSGYIIGKKGQRQLRTTHKCTIMKCTILLIKHNHSITPTFTVMNPLLRLSYGQCSSIPNPLLRPSPSQCGSPPSSNSPSTNPNQI